MTEQTQDIPINGICCGNSIVRAQKTIKAVAGVTGVRIDLARHVAQVRGNFNTETVIAALHAAGFASESTAAITPGNEA
ncbi:MAG: cation transporter [Gammaproteobacteria bacterium]